MIADPKIHIQTFCSGHRFGKDETPIEYRLTVLQSASTSKTKIAYRPEMVYFAYVITFACKL